MSDQPPSVIDHDNDRPTDRTRLSLNDAAEQLGISINTVCQRIKRGTLRGEKTWTGWVVFFLADQATTYDTGRRPTDQPSATTRPATNRPRDQAAIAPLPDLIADLSRQNQELAAAAQERARFLLERL
jgi:hypothetical protein